MTARWPRSSACPTTRSRELEAAGRALGVFTIANRNSPGQIVVSGETGGRQRRRGSRQGAGRQARDRAAGQRRRALAADGAGRGGHARRSSPTSSSTIPSAPLLANADARPLTTAEECRAELVEHLTRGVDWIAAVEYMTEPGRRLASSKSAPARSSPVSSSASPRDAQAVAARRRSSAPDGHRRTRLPARHHQPRSNRLAMGIRRPDFTAASPSPASASSARSGRTCRHRLGQPRQRPESASTRSRAGIPRPTRRRSRRGQRLRRHAVDGLQGHPPHRPQRGHLASPAAKQALADSGLEITDDNRDDIGVIFGSGGGGPYLLMENVEKWENSGARTVSPVLHRQHAARHGVRPDRDRDRHPRLEHVRRHGLLDGHAQHRRGGRGHPPR